MKTIRVEKERSVARVLLARPEVHNAFHPVMMQEIEAAFTALDKDDAVRVVILASEGESFSAGGDLNWMKGSVAFTQAQNEADSQRMADMFRVLDTFSKPLLVRVQGVALGGGVGLLACGDIVVAADTAIFALTEVRLGIIPAVIAPYVVRKIGISQAGKYFLTGERFSAQVARRLGLVHEVVAANQLDAAVQKQVGHLLKGGPKAHVETKSLLHFIAHRDPQDVAAETVKRIARIRVAAEAQEGISAFLEKRKPNWTENADGF